MSKVDYWNAQWSYSSLAHLQLVQCQQSCTKLPVHCIIQYKAALFVFEALNGLAPAYVVDILRPCTQDHNGLILTPDYPTVEPQFQSDPRQASTVTVFQSKLEKCSFLELCWIGCRQEPVSILFYFHVKHFSFKCAIEIKCTYFSLITQLFNLQIEFQSVS